MKELIDEAAANRFMDVLAVGLPAAGLLIGTLIGVVRGRLKEGAFRGLGLGCVGVANWLLWRLYNTITNRLGLDTVANLLVNLALFTALGVAAGIAAGAWASRQRSQ